MLRISWMEVTKRKLIRKNRVIILLSVIRCFSRISSRLKLPDRRLLLLPRKKSKIEE